MLHPGSAAFPPTTATGGLKRIKLKPKSGEDVAESGCVTFAHDDIVTKNRKVFVILV